MRIRLDKDGVLGYSWVYWAAIAAAFALLIVDIFDDGALWNVSVFVCIIIAIAARPGPGTARRRSDGGKRHAPT